ncbi:MAG: tetratricopeptide repeat protein [Phycisphaerales bacterium]|nr:tetratricopeptide repeat protein [Phycisphaerales bacterium]MCB9836235.1 tetratricopeptide repeat protein [Phycisphaera sp.]
MNRTEEADSLTTRILSEIENSLGKECDAYSRVLSYRAAAFAGLGRHAEAIEAYTASIDHFRSRFGPENMFVLVTSNNLGLVLIDAGQPDRAVEIYRQLLAIIEDRYESMRPSPYETSATRCLPRDESIKLAPYPQRL